MTDTQRSGEPDSDTTVETFSPDSDIGWLISSTLLRANEQTTRALEEHLYQLAHQSADRDVEQYLQRALSEHREIVENLELALAAAGEELDE